MRRSYTVALIAILVIVMAGPVFAAKSERVTTKIDRGTKNLITAPVEIPRAIVEVTKESNVIFGVLFGPIKGVLNCFSKAASGTADIVGCNTGDDLDQPTIKAKMVPDIEPKPVE